MNDLDGFMYSLCLKGKKIKRQSLYGSQIYVISIKYSTDLIIKPKLI